MTDRTSDDTSREGDEASSLDHSPHRAVARSCRRSGLEVTHPFDTCWYREVRPDGPELPAFGHDGDLGLLIGNTRTLWPHFLEALAEEPEYLESSDPLDHWVESVVREAVAPVSISTRLVWAHRRTDEGAFIPFQAIAASAGLAAISPSQLAIHPEYGPWWALRAAVIFDRPGPGGTSTDLSKPCPPCDDHCMEAFERALEPDASWQHWVAVREACPIGDAYRYSEDQIRYHYEKDRTFLSQLVSSHD